MNKNKKHMKYIHWIIISIFLICIFTGCRKLTPTSSENNRLDDGVSAVEDAMKNKKSNDETIENSKETRKGTSKNTIGTPKDFPVAYNYGTGKISDYKRYDRLF